MSFAADNHDLTAKQTTDLSALADGTLDPTRRDEVQAWVASSPELTARYERERRVAEMLHSARSSDRAPAQLRARIEAARPTPRVRARRRVAWGGALAGAVAVAALAAALLLPAGTPGAPSVSQAAALALRGPAAPAPISARAGVNLGESLGDLYFPDWARSFGWRAVGQRTDTINGRKAVTVYYQWRGRRIAYTIVGAPALDVPAGRSTVLQGTALRTLTMDGRLVVTWHRENHTCVLSGVGVPAAELHKLAAWRAPAA
jgi:anti-sigma factor RsiW